MPLEPGCPTGMTGIHQEAPLSPGCCLEVVLELRTVPQDTASLDNVLVAEGSLATGGNSLLVMVTTQVNWEL